MESIPFERYAASRLAFGVYGLPSLAAIRPSRRTLLILALVGLVVAFYAAGLLDVHSALGLALGAGPVADATARSGQLREEAIAKYQAAKGLEDGSGAVKAEDVDQYNALIEEGKELHEQSRKAARTEGNAISLREDLEDLTARVTGTPMRWQTTILDPNSSKSLGQQFVQSDAYKDLKASGALVDGSKQAFRASFQPGRFGAAATDVIQTESGGPGAGLVTPYYLPGIIPLPQRELAVRELFGQGTMEGDTVSYAQQTAFDNAAAAVAQATAVNNGAKPQSSIAWQRVTSPAEIIATWMAVTRQTLSDAGQVRALIDNQLRLMLQLEEEDQLINGNGTSPNLSGILDQAIQTLDLTGATSDGDPNLDGVRDAKRMVRTGLSRLRADAIVIHPDDSEEFDLLVDNEGRYRVGDPFGGNAGDGDAPIWRLRRVESEAVATGTGIVGAYKAGATVLEREPIQILTADQHSDFFVRNLVVILAEERLGFPVYFPSAFVEVTFDWS